MKPQEFMSGAIAKRTGTNVPTVRYYEEIGLLPPAARGRGGRRTYRDKDLARLTFIRRCRNFGFSIDQIRSLVTLTEDPSRDCYAARDLAQEHLNTVRAKLKELRQLEVELSQFVKSCNSQCGGGPAGECVILEDLAKPALGSCCGSSKNVA
jgi:MerR family transcriptional regulator, copper efflux regulator